MVLPIGIVPMITLSALVVIAHESPSGLTIIQRVLELVLRSGDLRRHAPELHLQDATIVIDALPVK
jgi:hypothetical protein